MLGKISVIIAGTLLAASAFAIDTPKQTIALKDGSTVYVFADGKMGMEDQLGHSTRMQPGHVMEAVDGTKIIMVGDEVARLNQALGKGPKD
jgi:hypothetical protein